MALPMAYFCLEFGRPFSRIRIYREAINRIDSAELRMDLRDGGAPGND